jgi:hypothetical protein
MISDPTTRAPTEECPVIEALLYFLKRGEQWREGRAVQVGGGRGKQQAEPKEEAELKEGEGRMIWQ